MTVCCVLVLDSQQININKLAVLVKLKEYTQVTRQGAPASPAGRQHAARALPLLFPSLSREISMMMTVYVYNTSLHGRTNRHWAQSFGLIRSTLSLLLPLPGSRTKMSFALAPASRRSFSPLSPPGPWCLKCCVSLGLLDTVYIWRWIALAGPSRQRRSHHPGARYLWRNSPVLLMSLVLYYELQFIDLFTVHTIKIYYCYYQD